MGKVKIIIAGVLWGFVGVFARYLVGQGLTSGEVVYLRFLFSAISLGIFLFFYDKNLLKPKKIFTCILLGVFNFFTSLCYYKCIEYSGAGIACVLLYCSPVVVVCVGLVLYKNRPSKITVLAIITTIIGLICAGNVFGEKSSKLGFLFGIFSAILNALVTLVGAKGENPLNLNFYGFVFSALLGTLFIKPNTYMVLTRPTPLFNVLFLAILCTVIPYTLYISGLKNCPMDKASVLCSLEPIVANVIECIIYFKKPTISLLIGLSCIVIAVWLIGINNKDEKSKKEGKYVDKQILQRSSNRTWQFHNRTKSGRS